MKTTSFWNLLILILLLGLLCNFTSTVSAQDYYPADVGNEWVLLSTDGEKRRIYTLEEPANDADRDLILLKIMTENIRNGKISGIDEYFVTSDNEGIKLHKTDLKLTTQLLPNTVINIIANFPTPVIFFPNVLTLGAKWKIEADTSILNIPVKSNNELEIVAFEDVVTPAATFYNCAKIQLKVSITDSPITLEPTISYQWLAPNIGPVKYETSDGAIFEIISFKRSPPVVNAQNPPTWNLPSNTFQVIGTRLGGILNAKILDNVEDYASEVASLGIVSVTGSIVPPGNGTGFATNLQRKQDLWVAGNFENVPIIGSITLYAENNKGRSMVTINVTISAN